MPIQSTTQQASIDSALQQLSNNQLPLTSLSNLQPQQSRLNINQPLQVTVSGIKSNNAADSNSTPTVQSSAPTNQLYTALSIAVIALIAQSNRQY